MAAKSSSKASKASAPSVAVPTPTPTPTVPASESPTTQAVPASESPTTQAAPASKAPTTQAAPSSESPIPDVATSPSTTHTPTDPAVVAVDRILFGVPPTPPALHQTTIPTLPQRLNAARAHLLDKGGYLGDPSTHDHYEWMRDGKSHKLVIKPLATSEDSSPRVLDIPQIAELSFVARISGDDFWLLSDAGWRGPTEWSKKFEKVKATGTFEAPTHAPFAADFGEILKNIKALEAKMVTPGFEHSKSILVGLGNSRIKVGHKLFEVR